MTTSAMLLEPSLEAPGALTWREAAIIALTIAAVPMNAALVVATVTELGIAVSSSTKTPTQTVNRDLHAAVRNQDPRVRFADQRGWFVATSGQDAPTAGRALPPPAGPRLPIEPLECAVGAAGGVGAVGLTSRTESGRRPARVYYRALERGWIDLFDADLICVQHLRVHPCLVFGESWWEALQPDVATA